MKDYNELVNTEFKPKGEIDIYNPNTSFNFFSRGVKDLLEDNVEYDADRHTPSENRVSVSSLDVAAYVLEKIGKCTTMKLHKLLYYCQAWSLVWDEAPLYNDKIEAWANGPVIRRLFNYHKGLYEVCADDFSIGNSQLLSIVQKETIDKVLDFYGGKSAQWLINLTHSETPWINARKGLGPSERGCNEIKQSDMAEYYSAL